MQITSLVHVKILSKDYLDIGDRIRGCNTINQCSDAINLLIDIKISIKIKLNANFNKYLIVVYSIQFIYVNYVYIDKI